MKGAYNRLLFVLRMSLSLCLSIAQFSEQAARVGIVLQSMPMTTSHVFIARKT